MPLIRPEYHPLDRIPTRAVLAAVVYGGGACGGEVLTVSAPIPQLGPALAEVWRAEGAVTREQRGDIEIARTGDVLFGVVRRGGGPTAEITAAVYDSIVGAVRSAGYPALWRIWNNVGGINELEEGMERYKRFSAGRHEALTRHGYARERFPAASAVGMTEPGLLVYFLAGRQEGKQVENPRQVSAYDYPPRYGPRSPSFSRATVVGDELIFVAGTASVVGHESRHAGSAAAQLEETIENLDATLAAATAGRKASAGDLTVVKIFVRPGTDPAPVEDRLRAVFPASMLLEADICRRELLLEIEGVAVLPKR
ncbi:MAG TPA: hypothetical protein VNA04_11375 [Thermoanaerobaculia bacterium]|nr:hypothetical protein [Thermoanaerobaculia bacterium]